MSLQDRPALESPQLNDPASVATGIEKGAADAVAERTGRPFVPRRTVGCGYPRCTATSLRGEAHQHFAQAHRMEHSDKLDVESARIGEPVDEKRVGADIVDPDPVAGETSLRHYALDRASRNEKFLEHPAVEFGQSVARGGRLVGFGGDCLTVGRRQGVAEVADHRFDKLSDQIVGVGAETGSESGVVFALPVGAGVVPLASVGVVFIAPAPGAQRFSFAPRFHCEFDIFHGSADKLGSATPRLASICGVR